MFALLQTVRATMFNRAQGPRQEICDHTLIKPNDKPRLYQVSTPDAGADF